jgi:hypothetical protein
LLVGPIAGQATHHFPLYLAEAALVELTALALARRSLYAAGAVAGALVGSLGVLAQWGWSHIWMPIPWPGQIVGEAVLRSLPVGIAAGLIGAWIASALRSGTSAARPAATPAGTPTATPAASRGALRWTPVAALGVIVISLGSLLPTTAPPVRAAVTLADAHAAPKRTVQATIRFTPVAIVQRPDWLLEFAWQGKENRRVAAALRQIGPGLYRTTLPLPVYGTWKAMIRFAKGSVMESVPIYFPADRAIPAREIPATAQFQRTLVGDHRLLQRERKHDVPQWLFAASSAIVAALVIALIGLMGWALQRITGVAGPVAGAGRLRTRPRAARRLAEATR